MHFSQDDDSARLIQPSVFQYVFDAVAAPCLILAPDFQVIAANTACLQATLHESASIVGHPVFELFAAGSEPPGQGLADALCASLERAVDSRLPDALPVFAFDFVPPVDPENGAGKRFWSLLNTPLLDVRGEVLGLLVRFEEVSDAVPIPGSLPTRGKRQPRLLLVEDSPVELEYLRTIFSGAGYEVMSAGDGEQALVTMRHFPPDLVVTDLMMPKMNGFELIRRIRAEPAIAATRVIILSATFRDQEAHTLGDTLGVARFLRKPAFPQGLLATVKEVLAEPAGAEQIAGPGLTAVDQAYRRLMNGELFRKTLELEREINERRQLEKNLRASEQRISGIVATAMDAIVTIDQQQRIVLFNTAAEKMFGCTASDAIGTAIDRFIPERYRAAHREHVRRFLNNGATVRAMGHLQSLSGLRGNGDEFPFEASISEVEAGGERLATVVMRDISARRAAELALQESEQRMHLAQQVARIGTFEWDLTGQSGRVSPELAALYGLPAEDGLDTYESWRERIHADDRPGVTQRVQKSLLTGQRFEAEWRVIWPDGSVHWLAGRAEIYRDEAGRPQRMLGVNIDISDRKEAEEAVRRMAQHDPLTGLPNRALLYEFAEHLLPATRRGITRAAFLFVDLDRFKPINDTYGHDVGDAVLKEVAERLDACLRGEDLVGRLGGDEFVAVLAHIHGEDDAAKIAFHVLDRLGQPYLINDLELHVSPSIGISLYPQDGKDVDELIKCADVAMYNAKQNGRNNVQFFQPELNARSEEALRIEHRLRRALELSEFELYMQPVIDLQTGTTLFAEALIRWPAMAASPERFIPVAEMAGFMQPLGAWILREACQMRRQWRELGLPACPVSVNVSTIQFRQSNFLQNLEYALNQADLQPADLKLEVTESMLINNLDEAVSLLQSIRDLGVSVALDDFGTGYSSLSHLTQLPIDIVKLDQSFVRNLGEDRRSSVVADSVINLANSLGLSVVAEGIESDAALSFLKAHHCQQGQGYLFSRPLPAREFEQWCRLHTV